MKKIVLALFLLSAPATAFAQASALETCDFFVKRITEVVNGGGESAIRNLLDPDQGARCFAEFVVERATLIDFISKFEGSRTDKQSGAGAGSSGTTSVVSQGPAAKVLSVAAEYGAVTQSVNGQVVTIRGNAAGLPSALVRKNVVPYCVPQDAASGFCVDDSLLGVLRRFSFAASFNATAQTEAVGRPAGAATPAGQPVLFEASRNQLASASVRFELWNRRDATSADFRKAWTAQVGKEMGPASIKLMESAGAFAEPIRTKRKDEYDRWLNKHVTLINAAAGQNGTVDEKRNAVVKAVSAALTELHPIMQEAVPDLRKKAVEALGAYNAFFLKQDEVIDAIAKKTVWAMEITNNRPAEKPHTSNLRLVGDVPVTKTQKLVFNAAMTWYDKAQANTDGSTTKYRDAQAAVQYEHGLGDLAIIGPATFSAAFYYQYQHAPALLTVDPLKPVPGVTFINLPDSARTVFAEKGDILLGQLKLSLTPKESSVKVPLAVTYSNRTELIDKPAWKAQIGVTYDFDSLFARGK